MSVSVWRWAVYPPLKINRNRRMAERSARLKPAILTGNRMEQRRCRWASAKQAIIIHLQDICHSQHNLHPQIALWCLTWITHNCWSWKQLSRCCIPTHLHFPFFPFCSPLPSSFSLISFPHLDLFSSNFLSFPLPLLFPFLYLAFYFPFFFLFLVFLFFPILSSSDLCFPYIFSFCLLSSPLFSFPLPLLSFTVSLPFSAPLLFPYLIICITHSSALLLFILQRSHYIGSALENQYQEITRVLLLFCY